MHSGRFISDPVQSEGLFESEYGRKQSAKGHPSMTSAHSEGIMVGLLLGFWVSSMIAVATVGASDGTGEGSGVGLQSILS